MRLALVGARWDEYAVRRLAYSSHLALFLRVLISGSTEGTPFLGRADRGSISSDRKPVMVVGSREVVSYSNDDPYR